MSPTRRDLLKLSVAGLAAAALPTGAIAAAIPATTADPQPADASAEPWGAREWGDYFELCMTSFPRCRDVTVEMHSEHMVKIEGKRALMGLSVCESGETLLYIVSHQALDQSGMKIAMNGLALAFAADAS